MQIKQAGYGDPDVTIAKAAYLQAANALAGVQQRQRAMLMQDSSVASAKEHLIELRHQLAYGR